MKKIVAALTASGLALTLAACGGNTATSDTGANAVALNDTIVTDEVPVDANLSVTGNGGDIAPVDPPVDRNASADNAR
jgi:ABC-type glycerol-3-phosphate transport system substrate-binding protein